MKRKITITFYVDDSHYQKLNGGIGDNIIFSFDGFYFRNYWENWTQANSGLELTLYPKSLEDFKFFVDDKEQSIYSLENAKLPPVDQESDLLLNGIEQWKK